VDAFDLQVVAVNLNFSVLALITPQIASPGSVVFHASVAPPVPLAATFSSQSAAAKDAILGGFAADGERGQSSRGGVKYVARPWTLSLIGDEGWNEHATRHRLQSIRDLAIESLTDARQRKSIHFC
jgi:hypothetical protein